MTTIDQLCIQGIRSFGSRAEDCQKIQFSAPVTLILGDNGCGKTTIIECLKYALTGDFPPGSDRGKSFIHDPKIFSLGTTMGQIKLQVKNLKGETLSVCRSMKISHKGDKSTFQTMDSTVCYPGETISNRVADVDGTMCQFMGVSKAIINNVLFCHQEDSNWPLDEAKKLKDKFDAIFGITEYNKAIEKVIKMRKSECDELKIKESNLRFLADLKLEMENKCVALKHSEDKCEAVKRDCTQCDDEIKPIDQRLMAIREIEYEVGKFQARQVEVDTEIKNCTEQIKTLGKKLKTPFNGTIEELDEELKTFKHRMAAKQLERHNLDDMLKRLNDKQKCLQTVYMEYDKKLNLLLQQNAKERECRTKRSEKIKRQCDNYNINIVRDDLSSVEKTAKVHEILEKLQKAMQHEKEEIATQSKQFDIEEQQQQVEIDRLRIESTKIQENRNTLVKQRTQNAKDLKELNEKIVGIEATSQQLQRITVELQRIDEMYEKLSVKFNQEALRNEINESKIKAQTLQSKFHEIDERLTFLNSLAKQIAVIDLKEQERKKKDIEIRRVKSKHSDNFKKLFKSEVHGANYRRMVQEVYEHMRREISGLNDQANSLKLKEQSFEITRTNLKGEITRLEREFDDTKERIYKQCHNTAYHELVQKCEVAVSKYQLEFGALRSAEAMYKKYIDKIGEDPCCPLCHNSMNELQAIKLTSDLNDEIHKLPENIARAEKALKIEQKRYNNLLELKPLIEKVAILENDLPDHKKKLKALEADLAEYANEQESLQMMLAEPTINLDVANSMFGDMSLLDEAIKESISLTTEISKLKSELPSNIDEGESIEILQAEKISLSAQLQEERDFSDNRQKDYDKTMDGLNKLREKKNSLKDQQIALQEGIQSLPQLKERHDELNLLSSTLIVNLQELDAKVEPLEQDLQSAIRNKEQYRKNSRAKLNALQVKCDANKSLNQDIQRLNTEVLESEKLNLKIAIENLEAKIKQNQTEREEHSMKITETVNELEVIKTECLQHEALERDLHDNREHKQLQAKHCKLQEQQQELQKQLGDSDFQRVAKEKNNLIRKRDDIAVRKGELVGKLGEINGQVKNLRDEIEKPKYKNAIENYRIAHYEVEIAKRLIIALAQQRLGLEWALMKFHKEKMENINRLIREYWRLIYQGNDIDYIQVQTEDDRTMKTNSADVERTRRSYSYHVIQSKNNSEIEMRGRCSAGQRVLACLIIRMALAETFGANCGVFALDEPTTNLDHKNIISLCDALNRIVDQRQAQTNFMLIIITHDEQFISTLGKIYSYQRVARDVNCKSIIRKVDIGYT